jgi:hypothetical protein
VTYSERLFADFCKSNHIACEVIHTGPGKTVDFEICISGSQIAVEVEALESMSGWNPGGVHTRKPGVHVRRKIEEARKQVQAAADAGLPTILLIYNAVDPMQLFGTEQHDFLAAMYGDLTWQLDAAGVNGLFHGRSSAFREKMNTSFSAVGHLCQTDSGANVHLYENAHARLRLPYSTFPKCIAFNRVQVESAV